MVCADSCLVSARIAYLFIFTYLWSIPCSWDYFRIRLNLWFCLLVDMKYKVDGRRNYYMNHYEWFVRSFFLKQIFQIVMNIPSRIYSQRTSTFLDVFWNGFRRGLLKLFEVMKNICKQLLFFRQFNIRICDIK